MSMCASPFFLRRTFAMWKTGVVFVALVACTLGHAVRSYPSFPSGKVVGGSDAQLGQFPYQVSLQYILGTFRGHNCGASILTANYLLTAGHCFIGLTDGYHEAVAGDFDFDVEEGTEQRRRVVEIIVHPDYEQGVALPNDLAILLLESPLHFSAYVQPILLPSHDVIPFGTAIVSGWGSVSTSSQLEMPSKMQFAILPILDLSVCRIATGGEGTLVETNVCTGPLTGGKGFCAGDSGGPLAQGNVLVGVVSWNFTPCGALGRPCVYTRVSAFVDWIRANTDL